ncbi:SGNH/GDSL hydrolase family protein [Humibacillus sp. DSM 29435]|uniref:SGNH/GDSL hydrolase family protein n=1 Tax=Humibacillus sp. DSM 29435 TaxID=1869167 RepID=UPI0009F1DCDE|nr:SGNH/GDSL hydrolase family protein [Humibacillus sp. DSM 29435]
MGRARRARKIAQTAAYGGGIGAAGLGALSLLGYGLIKAEAVITRRTIGDVLDGAPDDQGTYGSGTGTPIRFVVLGDSTGTGLGAQHAHQTVGATIASGVAAFSGRPVQLTNVAVSGAESADLDPQVDQVVNGVRGRGHAASGEVDKRGERDAEDDLNPDAGASHPDVAVILIGANDVTHRIDRSIAVRHLEMAVRRLREVGAEVVVGTCPDLGAIEPVPQPLRLLARRWSRDLAAAQTVAVVEAGGRAVSIGDLLGPEFSAQPKILFSEDRFHPSAAGYARVAAALLPSVSAALDLFGERSHPAAPNLRRGESVGPVSVAATRAVAQPGTEVSPAQVGGQSRGAQGRWAMLLHRVRPPAVASTGPHSPDGPPTSEPHHLSAAAGAEATPLPSRPRTGDSTVV